MLFTLRIAVAALCVFSSCSATAAGSWDGSIELEHRFFVENDNSTNLGHHQTSAKLEFEYFTDWNNGDDQLVFEPLIRIDEQDDERTHGDIRQLMWTHLSKNWEISAGIGRVFWGVTESQHLVDIINQTDGVENIDGEDKLGQAMIRYQHFADWGNLDLYILPYFRPRTFAGPENRLSAGFLVNNDEQIYESRNEDNNPDVAIRYKNTIGDWSLGFSWFKGTSREPDLVRFFDPSTFSTTPYYAQITQLGADIQLTTGSWLLKLEAIQRNHRDPFLEDFAAFTAGAEYTFVGVFGSVFDIGGLFEYSWDERQANATGIFQDDFFVGARMAFNDTSDSQLLLGFTQDLDDSDSKGVFIEAATRIGSNLTANIEARYFESSNPQELLFGLRDDSFIQVGLEYYFN